MTLQSISYVFLSSLLALFPVLNPIGIVFIVDGFLKDLDPAQRRSAAKKIFLNCVLIGLGSLAVGHLILLLFGLAIPVIQVGGGIVICKAGLEWLSEQGPSGTDIPQDQVQKIDMGAFEKKLFYPISFPISLGPGAISVIFTLMATANVKGDLLTTGVNYALIALAIVLLLAAFYFMLTQSGRITRKLGDSGKMIINKLVAFITFCIGIQIVVTGISKIFHLEIL